MAGDVDFVAFIDDDEVADPLWLDELLSAQIEYGAGIVHGPVINRYEPGTPEWYIKSGVVEQKRFATGSSPGWVCTNNVLVKLDPLRKLDGPFDEFFAMTGGSDVDLFMRLRNLGVRNVWADEAVVTEYFPASRATMGWILRRQFRIGSALTMISKRLDSRIWPFTRITFGVLHICYGGITLPAGLVFGGSGMVKPVARIARGVGMIAGVFGLHHDEYKKTHGK